MKKVQSNLPAPVKAAVLARYLAGDSNSQIARDLLVSRPTIAVILAESEIGEYVADGRRNLMNAIPRAVDNLIGAVMEGNVMASITLLKGIGMLTEKLIVEDAKPVEDGNMPNYFTQADARIADQPN